MPVLYENVFQLALMTSFIFLILLYTSLLHINFNLDLGMNETNETNETAILEKTTVSFHS